ncbi:hypothetical protein [Streptomyces sp. S186]|uniref:hypothetical protein n=1 Tax=Streptomyces sp. S186 TaxID=3434395 RepID=UPI003F66C1A3
MDVGRGVRAVDQVADFDIEPAAVQGIEDQAGLLDLDVLQDQDGSCGHVAVSGSSQ